jgi:hypothetical protein
MPNPSGKDEELFSALKTGAAKTEVETLIRDGADAYARDKVPISVKVLKFCFVD